MKKHLTILAFMKHIISTKFPVFILMVFLGGWLLLFPQHARAAIAFDSSATSTTQTASPITWNHTVGSGTNTLLVVGCTLFGLRTGAQPTATAATFNGVSMTEIRAEQRNISGGAIETSVWFLHAPASGTYQVSVTATIGTSPKEACASASYTGVQQIDTADASNGLTGNTTGDNTFTVTTIADNAWIFSIGLVGGTSPTITSDQTSRGTVNLLSTVINRAEDTNVAMTPAGTKTVGFTIGGTGVYWTMTGASFAPASTVAASSFNTFIVKLGNLFQVKLGSVFRLQ
jgi:hypothetical protein